MKNGSQSHAPNTNGIRDALSALTSFRFLRFSLVGAVSTIISLIVFNVVYYLTGILPLSQFSSIVAGAANGACWHRAWTFRDRRADAPSRQVIRFLAVTTVSCIISTVISAAVIAWWPFGPTEAEQLRFHNFIAIVLGLSKHRYSPLRANVGALAGGLVALAWSYSASAAWAFRR